MGFADLGCYGSDILTPNIDALAAEGIRFSNFHSAPSCAPTRASLLSGTDNHTAGVGSQFNRTGEWGYEGHLSDRVISIPQLLTLAGYNNYMAGKWHLGGASDHLPDQKGFQRSFIMREGAGNHYNAVGITEEGSSYRLDGDTIAWPKGAYSTNLYTDYIIDFIDQDKNSDKPFF
jgi:arylsulfatase